MRKPGVSRRLTEWAIELSEFNIKVVPAKSIKGQALTDFIAKLTPKGKEAVKDTWTMHVDRSSSKNTSHGGIVLTDKEGQRIEHAIHFSFPATNNVAE